MGASALVVAPAFILAPAALLMRFRRSRGVQREQLKWLVYTAVMTFGVLFPLAFSAPKGFIATIAQGAAVVGLGLLPVAIGIAFTRYRLYDIDVLIRRTVVYGAMSGTLILAYLAAIVVFQALLRPFASGSELAVTGSTLVVVALFQPIRSRIQKTVDRRFFRSKYDAERILDTFAARLREEVDLGAVEGELLEAVRATVQPAHAGVWLRAGRHGARPAAGSDVSH